MLCAIENSMPAGRQGVLRGLLVGLIIGLGGCVAGPNFQRPEAPATATYTAGLLPAHTAATPVHGGAAQHFVSAGKLSADWYRLFGSASLDHLIGQALQNSPTLAAAQARLRQAQYQLAATEGSRYPQVDANAGISRNRGNGAAMGIANPAFSNVFNLYSARVGVSYDLDLAGARKRRIEASQAALDYQHYTLAGSYLTLVDNLVAEAVTAATLQDQLTATRKIIAAERHQLELVRAQEKAGVVSQADVLRAESQLAETRAQIPGLEQQLNVAQHQLALLIGQPPARFHAPQFSLADFKLPRRLPVSLPSALVRQRPDILAAEAVLHQASAQVGVATANLYPQLSLTASYGTQADVPSALLNGPAAVWSLGGQLLAPVFHGQTLRAERDAAVQAYQQALADYRHTVLGAFTQVADVLTAIQHDADGVQAEYRALTAARDSRRLTEAQFQQGSASYLDVLVTEQQYQRAVIAYTQAIGRRYADTALLYQALGGGWWHAAGVANGAPATPVQHRS